MKTINETFSDEEYTQLTKLKGSLTWHDFILVCCGGYRIAKKIPAEIADSLIKAIEEAKS